MDTAAAAKMAGLAARRDAAAALAAALLASPALRRAFAATTAPASGLHPSAIERLLELWPRGLDVAAVAARQRAMASEGALPAGPIAIFAPGNLPVAALTAVTEALLLGCAVRIRPGSGDPDAPEAIAALWAAVAPALAADIAVHRFARSDDDALRAFVAGAAAVIVFGDDASVATVRARVAAIDATVAVRGHGARLSLGWVGAGAPLDDDAIDALWHDALLADGRGCLSLRALLVAGGPERAEQVAEAMAARLPQARVAWPPGNLAPEIAAMATLACEDDRLAVATTGGLLRQVEGATLSWRREPPRRRLALAALGPGAGLLRLLAVDPATAVDGLLAALAGKIASVAVLGDGPPAAAWRALGVDRVCAPGALQAPPWHCHDGVPLGQGLAAAGRDALARAGG